MEIEDSKGVQKHDGNRRTSLEEPRGAQNWQ